MSQSQIEALAMIRRSLECVTVCGSANMNFLLGSIQTLDALIEQAQAETAEE